MPTPPHDASEHFLPVDLDELTDELVGSWRGPDGADLARFCLLYAALHRAGTADRVRALKRRYRPFDPDRDTVTRRPPDAAERRALREALRGDLVELLREANYEEIPPAELELALDKTSPRGLRVSVDLESFDELGLHFRGSYVREDHTRDWRRLGFAKRAWRTPVYRRLFLFLKLRDDGEEGERVFLKLFRDVPQSDLEMLLPNTKVRMRIVDKLKLGVTGGGGTAGGVAATVTKLGAAANPTTWALALAGLAGVLWRQVSKVLAQRTRYMADLARQLYFRNLDNNLGALVHLVEAAHVEETKEALLAYATLAEAGEQGLERAELDRRVEALLADAFDVRVDYEVDDGLAKLERAGLLRNASAERLVVRPPTEAVRLLDRRWDDLFVPPDAAAAGAPARRAHRRAEGTGPLSTS